MGFMPNAAAAMRPPQARSTHARMSGDDRRRQLIEVAIDLFSRKGFGGTTTKEIAAAAGVTEAIIFRHFATKQDFYKAILDYKVAESGAEEWMAGAEAFMRRNDDAGLFRFLVAKIIEIYREDTRFERLLMHAALEGNELAIMHHSRFAEPIGMKFKEYIRKRQAEGAIRECDPGIVLMALAGIPQFYAMRKYVYSPCDFACSDEEVIDTFMTLLMDGLRNGAERKPPKRRITGKAGKRK